MGEMPSEPMISLAPQKRNAKLVRKKVADDSGITLEALIELPIAAGCASTISFSSRRLAGANINDGKPF